MSFFLQAILLGLSLSCLSLGIFISMKIFNIPDITADGSYTLGAVITGLGLVKGWPIGWVMGLAFLCSALAGSLTGFIGTQLKVNPLLSGILVSYGLYSVNLSLLGKSNIALIQVRNIFAIFVKNGESTQSQTWVLVCFVSLVAFLVILLLKTDFGIAMRATGNSETMVRSMGVNTNRMKIMGLALANGLVGLSGFLVAQYQGYVDVNMGIGIVITGLGSVGLADAFLNFFPIPKVALRVLGVVLGTLIFQSLLGVAISLGIDPNFLKLITAGLVLLVVIIPLIKFTK